MGASSSAPLRPFTVSTKQKEKLKLLSMVVNHIMNTPDIYDLDNLVRPGACGDYAVVLKTQIEQKFLPFVVDISGETGQNEIVGIIYQNPNKLIKSETKRKKICQQLADTALRIASIVLACLSSIQIANEVQSEPSRYPGYRQIGGGLPEILSWLQTNQYIDSGSEPIRFRNIASGKFLMTTYQRQSQAQFLLTAEKDEYGRDFPKGSFILQFLNPIIVPGTTESFLPIRLLDSAGAPWIVGVLFKQIYKPLIANSISQDIHQIWNNLFKFSQSHSSTTYLNEKPADLLVASSIFETIKTNPKPMFDILTPWMKSDQDVSRYFVTYNPGFSGPGLGQYPNQYPNQYPGPGLGQYPNPGYPGYSSYPNPSYGYPGYQQARPLPPALYPRPGPVQYSIPNQQSNDFLNRSIRGFREIFNKKSCPASVRVNTIFLQQNPDRSVRSGICNDPYWRESNLAKIFPFVTLQFLCIKDWTNSSGFTEDFTTFTTGLSDIYGDFLTGKGSLEQMSFKMSSLGLDNCKIDPITRDYPKEIIVKQQQVADCTQEIEAEYSRHTKIIWSILERLVEVIEDPETKTDLVRLVPAATRTGTKAYIEAIAVEARQAIVEHYINIERIYYKAAKNLTPLAHK